MPRLATVRGTCWSRLKLYSSSLLMIPFHANCRATNFMPAENKQMREFLSLIVVVDKRPASFVCFPTDSRLADTSLSPPTLAAPGDNSLHSVQTQIYAPDLHHTTCFRPNNDEPTPQALGSWQCISISRHCHTEGASKPISSLATGRGRSPISVTLTGASTQNGPETLMQFGRRAKDEDKFRIDRGRGRRLTSGRSWCERALEACNCICVGKSARLRGRRP